MPTPFADFESNFRTAQTLLKVHSLLNTPGGPQTEHVLMRGVRDLLMAGEDEELILLVNELFLGVVRQHADVRPAVFKADSLSMLLRQAVVAACSAIDVYYPALLRQHLSQVIAVKQRNFLPSDGNTRDFLKDFRLKLDDSLRLLSDPEPARVLGDLFVEHLKGKTLSNSQGVAVSLLILGVDEPWNRLARQIEQPKEALVRQFDALVSRRNDIVHRGDRSSRDPTGSIQPLAYSWADSHIYAARSVVLASEELVEKQMQLLSSSSASNESSDG